MKCEDALLLISGHIDKENTAEEEIVLHAHLDACEDCRAVLGAYEQMQEHTNDLWETAPSDLCANVMGQIKKENKAKKIRPWFGLAAAAALVLVVGLGAVSGYSHNAAAESRSPAEVQTVSEGQPQMFSRSIPMQDGETVAEQLANDRGADVVLVRELYYEIETYDCETLPSGYLLYILPERDSALLLSETYGCLLYEPQTDLEPSVSYALLVP